jgi:anti-sigma B factor antagonist
MSFAVTVEKPSTAVYVIAPAGELDAYRAPDVRAELVRVIEAGAAVVVCDLTAVTFLDSSGLGVLIGALKRLRERDGELYVVPGKAGRRILELTALDRVVELYESRAAALAAAGGRR